MSQKCNHMHCLNVILRLVLIWGTNHGVDAFALSFKHCSGTLLSAKGKRWTLKILSWPICVNDLHIAHHTKTYLAVSSSFALWWSLTRELGGMTPPLNTLTASLQPAEMSFQDQKKGHPCPAAYQSNDMVNAYTIAIFIKFKFLTIYVILVPLIPNNIKNMINSICFHWNIQCPLYLVNLEERCRNL